MACPGSRLLLNFRLVHVVSGQVAYRYACSEELSSNSICVSTSSNSANFNSASSTGNTNYLDRLYPDCGSSGALNSFKLKNLGSYRFQYDIRCCKPATTSHMECNDHYTDYESGGGWQVIYLDRHFLSCPTDTVMSFFRLQPSGSNLRYHYKCCQIINSET